MVKAHQIQFDVKKTYATRENSVKAVQKLCGENHAHFGSADVRYIITATADGRFLPVFIGESAINKGMHFHFCVAA